VRVVTIEYGRIDEVEEERRRRNRGSVGRETKREQYDHKK